MRSGLARALFVTLALLAAAPFTPPTSATTLMSAGPPAADLIVTNAKMHTGDPLCPECAAVAIIGDRIVATGSRAEIDAWRGPATRVIDAGGRRVVPGFNDAHVHFVVGGMDLDNVDLKDAPTREEFVKRIAAQVAKTPKGEWVQGGNWDETMWSPATLPDR